MDSLLSFPVGLFHPLQQAGLSRRSPCVLHTAQGRSGALWATYSLSQSVATSVRLDYWG
jgi:hypothetical protein